MANEFIIKNGLCLPFIDPALSTLALCNGCVIGTTPPPQQVYIRGGGTNSVIPTCNTLCNVITNSPVATILSGCCNSVSNSYLSIIGSGVTNTIYASGLRSSILSGCCNLICGISQGFIGSGSCNNLIDASATSISSGIVAGTCNYIFGTNSFIGAGDNNRICQTTSLNGIVSGCCNYIYTGTCNSFIGSGRGNIICATTDSFIGGGNANQIQSGNYNTIGGGITNNIATGAGNNVSGGELNWVFFSAKSSISGGHNNFICCNSCSVIAGGSGNRIFSGCYNNINGGINNQLASSVSYTSISGGESNLINCTSCYSSIGGGSNNLITNNSCFSVILGGDLNRVCGGAYSGVFGCNVCNNVACSFASNQLWACNLVGTTVALCVGTDGIIVRSASDCRLKTNICNIPYGLCEVKQLNPVSFNWNNVERETRGCNRQLGFIAQEVEPIIPEAVGQQADNGTYSLSPDKIIPVLTKALQELSVKFDAQEERLILLEDIIKRNNLV